MSTTSSRPPSRARNTALLGIAALALISVVGVSYREWRQYSRANAGAAQSRAIVDSLDRLLASLIDAETGQRGFLLTGETRYLEPYNRAIQEVPAELSAALRVLATRSGQFANAARLNALTADELAELRDTVELRRTRAIAPPLAIFLSDRGKQTMDQIRAISAQIRQAEISSQSQAATEGEAAAGTALLATVAGSLVLLFLFAFGLEPFASPDPQAQQRSWTVRYGSAVLAVVVMVLFRMALTPLMGSRSMPFTLFFPAVWFAAWFGGLRPGALSIALSGLAGTYFFAEPTKSLLIRYHDDQIALLMLVVVGFGMGLLSRSQQQAVLRAMQAENAERNERQRFETTLASIGDAVIATDHAGRVTFANKIALSLMRCAGSEIAGKPLDEAFRIVNEFTRAAVESPATRVLREGAIVGLANHTVLIARDGTEVPIDDSAAPIRAADGSVQGTVLVFRDITERRRAEAARQLLASIVDSSEDAIIGKDLNGIVTTWNRAAERMLGYAASEMIGRPVSVLAVPDRPDEMPEILERIKRGERIEPYQTLRRRKDGTVIHVSLSVSPLYDASGRITGASKILRDITAQVRAQQELAEQRERLRVTLRSIGDAVIATGTQGGVTYLNPVAETLTGWTSEEAAGRPLEEIFRIINEQSRQTVQNPVARVLREGKIVGLANHTLLISRNGKELAIDDSAAPIRDVRGEMMGVVLVFRDVSEKRAAEKLAAAQAAELRHSEERLATVMRHLPVGVGVIDTKGHVVIANPAWKAFLRGDIPSVDLQEARRWRAVSPEGRPVAPSDYPGQRALRGEEVLPGINFLRKEDAGVERWMRVSAVPLRDQTGQITGALAMLQDIDEERRAEAQRAELLAKERALEIEKALRETEAELARVTRALSLGELASSIAHEVNQPLAGVVTNAEAGLRWLSGDTPNIEEAKESLAMIAEDGARAGEVIRRLREFLKKRRPETAPLDINEVVREAVALTRAELERREVEIRMELSGNLPPVSGDRIQLQQVIVNLIMNGAEAIADTGASRKLVAISRRSVDGRILVAVRDSGVGIRAEDMPRMFDAFFTTKATGMGMGLSISRSILEAHGGRIWAEANEGPGLTVQFSLPVQQAGGKSSTVGEPS
jgi:PAS domain S-box-containing protein